MDATVGYNFILDHLEIDPDEAKIVAFIYTQRDLYSRIPPEALVDEIFNAKVAEDPNYTRDMAVDDARKSPRIDAYIAEDVNREFPEELVARSKRKLEDSQQPSYNPKSEHRRGQIAHQRDRDIIDRATYEAVQAQLKENK